jgi:hypothetical protein
MTFLTVFGRRLCAALAVGSASLHAVMLGHASGPVAAALLAVMIGACVYCAVELWRGGKASAWVVVALMNLAMIAVHLPTPAHRHDAVVVASMPRSVPLSVPPSTLMTVGTLLALIEVLAAAAALYVGSRGRRRFHKPIRR